jgi:hypothetical protein
MRFIYEFEFLKLDEINNLYGKFRKYGVGKFLDVVYRKSIRLKKLDRDGDFERNEGFVYVSKIEIERYLGNGKNKNGEYYWSYIIKSLSKRGYIKYRRFGRNKFDFDKKLWCIKLDDEFFNCKKSKVEIGDWKLVKWLDNRNKKFLEKWVGLKKVGEKKLLDKFIKYEIDVCLDSNINISQIDLVIEKRVRNKIKEYKDRSEWLWVSKKDKEKCIEKLVDDSWIEGYKKLLKDKYFLMIEDLELFKKGEYSELSEDYFMRDRFGGRIYNLYSNVVREFREFIKIDGEDVVEIDLKNSMICCLYYLVRLINSEDKVRFENNDVEIIYKKLKSLNDGFKDEFDEGVKLSLDYLNRWNYILNLSEDKINKDYYKFLCEEFNNSCGIDLSRNCFKELLFVLLFGNDNQLKTLRLGDLNYDELKMLMLGSSRFIIDDIKKISLFDWYKDVKYKKHKNVSLILMKLERSIMDIMSNYMIQTKTKYISVFDGFVIKKKGSKEVLDFLNDRLGIIDKVFRLELK